LIRKPGKRNIIRPPALSALWSLHHISSSHQKIGVQYYDTDGDITYLDTEEAEKEKLIPISKDQYSHLAVIEKGVNDLFNISMLGNEKSDCHVSGEEVNDISCEASALYRRLYKAYGKECKAIINETT